MHKRYTVTKFGDGMGNRYAGGPLTFVDTDELAEAQHYVHRNGGEVIAHQTRNGWSPFTGWWDAGDYIDYGLEIR